MVARNLELKARCTAARSAEIAAICVAQARSPLRTLCQRDTYFRVPQGRLKLREISDETGESAELIQYTRPDLDGMRVSTYRRTILDPDNARILRESLADALGTLVEVRKRRDLAILWRTRVHLDEVDTLGTFIELETVLEDGPESEERGRAEYEMVCELLELGDLESVAGSYSDLLLAEEKRR